MLFWYFVYSPFAYTLAHGLDLCRTEYAFRAHDRRIAECQRQRVKDLLLPDLRPNFQQAILHIRLPFQVSALFHTSTVAQSSAYTLPITHLRQ